LKGDTENFFGEEKPVAVDILGLELVALFLSVRAAFGRITCLPRACSHFFRFQPRAAWEEII
jgi:hypothetical protein